MYNILQRTNHGFLHVWFILAESSFLDSLSPIVIGVLTGSESSSPKVFNISLSIGIVAIFFSNLKENNLMVVKRIMRYLKGIEEFGLYDKKNEKFDLRAYIDAN